MLKKCLDFWCVFAVFREKFEKISELYTASCFSFNSADTPAQNLQIKKAAPRIFFIKNESRKQLYY